MDADLLAEAIIQVLSARYPKCGYISVHIRNNTKCIAGEYVWYADVEVQVDTDMIDCVRFQGGGATVLEAMQAAFRSVLKDQPTPIPTTIRDDRIGGA